MHSILQVCLLQTESSGALHESELLHRATRRGTGDERINSTAVELPVLVIRRFLLVRVVTNYKKSATGSELQLQHNLDTTEVPFRWYMSSIYYST